ncbi:MAG: hypothetical protein V5A72_03435 [Candidatus Nanohaloarchaea archaeon]
MDVRILAAVFISLGAVFAGADGGMFSSDVREVQSSAGLSTPSINSFTGDLPIIGKYLKKPKPENKVKAEVKFTGDTSLNLNKADIKASNLTSIKAKNMKIDSDSDVEFKSFTGKIEISNTTNIKGDAKGLDTSGVNITTRINLETNIATEMIKVKRTEKTGIQFSSASIGPTPDSDFSLDTENTNLNINSFSGDIIIYPKKRTFILDGKVDELRAGKYSLEG